MSLPKPSLPNALGAFTITSASFSVALPNTIDSAEERRSFTAYVENVDSLDGGIRTRPTSRDPIELSISGSIASPSIARDIRRTLGEKSVTVTRSELDLECEVVDFALKEVVTNELWNFAASFVSPKGYWSGGEIVTSANPTSVSNSGDIETYPRLLVTGGVGGATAVSISIDGREALYSDTIGAGQVLSIDSFAGTANLDGVGVLSNMNDEFFTNPIRIPPGSHAVTYSITGAADVVIRFEERYL